MIFIGDDSFLIYWVFKYFLYNIVIIELQH